MPDPSTCVCTHPRGDHREGLHECTSCPCLAFSTERPAPVPSEPKAKAVQTKAKRLPATRKRR